MDFLDIIWIVVCIVLLAVPDLVINNKKKKSARGRTRTSGPISRLPENFPMPPIPSVPSEPESMPIDDEEKDFPVWTEPVVESPVAVQTEPEVVKKPAPKVSQKDSSLSETGKKPEGLRVDPRNLVIYTAIMEPKFKEV